MNLNENAIITDLSYTNKIDITDGTTYHVVLYLQSRHLIDLGFVIRLYDVNRQAKAINIYFLYP